MTGAEWGFSLVRLLVELLAGEGGANKRGLFAVRRTGDIAF